MIKKRATTLALCAILLFCVFTAGCSGPAASPSPTTQSSTTSSTASSTAAAATQVITPTATFETPSVTSTPSETPTASATPTPSGSPSISAGLTVQYFYEVGCPICQNFTPLVYQLQNDVNTKYPGKVTVTMISNPDDYGVQTVPTLVLLNNGVEVGRWVNPGTTAPVTAQIDSLLASG